MRIKHRIPSAAFVTSQDIPDDYAREVAASVERAENAYAAAERRLAKAEARLAKLQSMQDRAPVKHRERQIEEAWAIVELRRQELDRYARMAAASPQPAGNRGRDSYRPVPVTHRLL